MFPSQVSIYVTVDILPCFLVCHNFVSSIFQLFHFSKFWIAISCTCLYFLLGCQPCCNVCCAFFWFCFPVSCEIVVKAYWNSLVNIFFLVILHHLYFTPLSFCILSTSLLFPVKQWMNSDQYSSDDTVSDIELPSETYVCPQK